MTFRPDIEGLRALSILFVAAYHYFPWLLPGGYVGVDVFFVISGYLITLSLLDHRDATGSLGAALLAFWSRRARRLLPNALLVLVAISVAGIALMSDYALKRLGSDVFWSATYSVNWLFVLRSLDYLQWDDTRISVLLNFWSLAVEEQFYFVWPAVLLAVLGRAPSSGRAHARALAAALGFGLCSLGYCLFLSSTNLTLGFFSSPARAWELLSGAAIALAHRRSAERGTPSAGAWRDAVVGASLLALGGAALGFGEDTTHPGWPTLLPVVGAVGLIAFGASSPLAQRWLATAPMRAVGARSYSIYLWHWPVLVLARPWLQADAPWQLGVVLAGSLALAEAAYRWVELPARFRYGRGWSPRRLLTLAVIGSGSVALLGFGLRAAGATSVRELVALRPRVTAPGMAQATQRASIDLPVTYRQGCHLALEQTDPGDCRFGAPDGREAGVLFGDSHAAQWFPALDRVAAESGFRLYAWTKSSCPSADVSIWNQVAKAPYRQCDDWRETVLERIAAMRPRIVFVSNLVDDVVVSPPGEAAPRPLRGREAQAAYQAGMERTLKRLRQTGAIVVLIRDVPRPRPDIMDCLGSTSDVRRCELGLAEATRSAPIDVWAAAAASVPVWDFSEAICPQGRCPVVVEDGATIVYRDSNHLTATFVRTLAPEVARQWRQTLADRTSPPLRR